MVPETPTPSRSRDGWILSVVVIAAAVSAVSFLTYFADRNEAAAEPPWIVEEFNTDRADLSGSPLADDHQWEVDGGAFKVADGAVTATAAEFGDAFAVVRFEKEPTTVSVLVANVSAGSGVVVDFVDRSNYLSVEAAPDFATWNVYRMHDGLKTFIANSGNNFRSGSTIEVRRLVSRIEIRIDGDLVPALIAGEWPRGSGAGLFAGPNEQGRTTWTRFIVTAAPETGR